MTLANTTLVVEIAFSAAPFATNPTWTNVTQYVRKVTTKRGRSNEIGAIEAGTATILLDNGDGRFTPGRLASPSPYNGNIKPRKQVRIRAVVSNVSKPIWTGYTERWSGDHPGGGEYAEVTLECVDGMKILGDKKLLDFYGEHVKSLGPTAYYPLTEPAGSVFFSDKSIHHNPAGVFYHRSTKDKSSAGSDAMLTNSGGTSVSFDPDGTSPGADIDLTGALSAVQFRPAGWSMVGWLKLAADFYNPSPSDPPPDSINPDYGDDPDPYDPYAPGSPDGFPVGGPEDYIDVPTDPTPPDDPVLPIPDEPVAPVVPVPDIDTPPGPTVPGAPGTPTVVDEGDGTGTISWAAPEDDGGGIIDSYRAFADTGGKDYEGAAASGVVTGFNSFLCNAHRVQAHNERGWGPLSAWSKCSRNPGEIAGPYDTFNRANTAAGMGTADCGTIWGDSWGNNLKITSNQAALVSSGNGGQLLNIGTADQDFTFIITQWGTFSIYMRASDKDNCYRLDCSSSSTKLYKRIAGVDTFIDQAGGYGSNTDAVWHVEAIGGRIFVARAGVAQLSVYDESYTSINGHKAGLYFDNTSTRGDEFIPGELTMPRLIRSYPLDHRATIVFAKPGGHPEATHYRVNIGGTDFEYDTESLAVTGLDNFTEYPFTVQAKIGDDWGLASDTCYAYPGYCEAPTLPEAPEASGSGNVYITIASGDPGGMDYNSARLKIMGVNRAGTWSLDRWLSDVIADDWVFHAFSVPTGAQQFRFYIHDLDHTINHVPLANITSAWSQEVVVT